MMDVVNFFSQHPFLSGLVLGLAVTVFVWVRGLLSMRGLRKEITSLKESLFTKMQIETKGQTARENELKQLEQQNENLRITIQSLQNKPGRTEIRQLHVYDRAIHAMLARAPGFAPTWEMVLKEAEAEVQQTETGVSAFIRKVFIPQKQLTGKDEGTLLIDLDDKKNGQE